MLDAEERPGRPLSPGSTSRHQIHRDFSRTRPAWARSPFVQGPKLSTQRGGLFAFGSDPSSSPTSGSPLTSTPYGPRRNFWTRAWPRIMTLAVKSSWRATRSGSADKPGSPRAAHRRVRRPRRPGIGSVRRSLCPARSISPPRARSPFSLAATHRAPVNSSPASGHRSVSASLHR